MSTSKSTSTTTAPDPAERPPRKRLLTRNGPGSALLSVGSMTVPVRVRGVAVVVTCAVLLVLIGGFALTLGEYQISADEVVSVLTQPGKDPLARFFLLERRPPRVLAAMLCGLALGVGGALTQSVTGNPLGSPDILGFTTGAATGAVVAIVVVGADLAFAGPAAVLGALVTLAVVVALSRRREDGVPMPRLVLVGVGVGAGLAGLNRFLMSRASVQTAMTAAQWESGSLVDVSWGKLLVPAIAIALLLVACAWIARGLTVVGLGDDAARALGADPGRVRVASVLLGVLLVAVATAVAGPIAFVAMAAPHASRILTKADRPGLVVSGVTGAVIVTAADVLGRTALPHGEVPVGLVTGVVGGVYLIVLLARSWRRGEL